MGKVCSAAPGGGDVERRRVVVCLHTLEGGKEEEVG